jgi:uncharacterized membrane protein YbaN (DUF454 family)
MDSDQIQTDEGMSLVKVKKAFFVFLGILFLVLGIVGLILPLIPTTPFLLVASYFFMKGSKKFDKWFKGTSIYKKHLEEFVKEKALSRKKKITINILADIMIAIPFILTPNIYVRIILVLIVLIKYYYFIFKIKTKKE